MALYIDHAVVPSPFKVLRKQSGLKLADMADAIYVQPSMLKALEDADWDKTTFGAPVVVELLARVACVVSAKESTPAIGGESLTDAWMQPIMELGNSFNFARG